MEKEFLQNLLNKDILKIEEIQNKDGISVVRIFCGDGTFVLKYFENIEYAREIEVYKLFKKLNIKTLLVKQLGPNYILMEDINSSKNLRLAVKEDLNNDNVLKYLAKWYKDLHKKGKNIDLSGFYCEYDWINRKNIRGLSKILSESVMNFLLDNIRKIEKLKNSFSYTLIYNDFDSCNLIVGKDCAFMFDYNFVGKGGAIQDLQNVFAKLTPAKQQLFMKYYGDEQRNPREEEIHKILSALSTLIIASKQKVFPKWGNGSLDYINSEEFNKKLVLV